MVEKPFIRDLLIDIGTIMLYPPRNSEITLITIGSLIFCLLTSGFIIMITILVNRTRTMREYEQAAFGSL